MLRVLSLLLLALTVYGQQQLTLNSIGATGRDQVTGLVADPGYPVTPTVANTATNVTVSGLSSTITGFGCTNGDFLVVAVNTYAASQIICTNVTCNGSVLTKAAQTNWYSASSGTVSVWTLANPSSGNIVASFDKSTTGCSMSALLLTNATSIGPVGMVYSSAGATTRTLPVNTWWTDLAVSVLASQGRGTITNTPGSVAAHCYYTNGPSVAIGTAPGAISSINITWNTTSSQPLSELIFAVRGKYLTVRDGMTLYVDGSAGNDTNSGLNPSMAWKTLAHASTNISSGNTVVLAAGQTFNEQLSINGAPLTNWARITSSASNRAKVYSTNGYGTLFIENTPYVQIDNLVVANMTNSVPVYPGWGSITNCGILFQATNGSTFYAGPIITNCYVSDASQGIMMTTTDVTGGYTNWRITHCTTSNTLCYGMLIVNKSTYTAFPGSAYYNFVGGYTASNNIGWSMGRRDGMMGIGFGLYNARDVTNEYLWTHDCGQNSHDAGNGGAGGFVLAVSTNVLLRYSEAARIHMTDSNVDGVGIDIDMKCTNCTMYANYVHNCDGAGIYHFAGAYASFGNQICYNVGVSNRAGTSGAELSVVGTGVPYNVAIYNNTLVSLLNGKVGLKMDTAPAGNSIVANNILYTTSGTGISVPTLTGTVLLGNDYYGSAVGLYAGSSYATLALFRTASSQESGTGFAVDPLFSTGGNPGDAYPALPSTVTAWALQGGSSLLNAAQDISAYVTIPIFDFRGYSTSTNSVGAYAQ